ncbi:unnamed protein product [Calypogeia fissa]
MVQASQDTPVQLKAVRSCMPGYRLPWITCGHTLAAPVKGGPEVDRGRGVSDTYLGSSLLHENFTSVVYSVSSPCQARYTAGQKKARNRTKPGRLWRLRTE